MTKSATIRTGIQAVSMLLVLGGAVAANELPHWEYEGESGPEAWGELHEEYKACGQGNQQSPIDIVTDQVVDADLLATDIRWAGALDLDVVNNGHAIQGVAEDMGDATINGHEATLKQFHFHAPSEHLIDGKSFPAEAHFVHQTADGSLAVIGVLLEGGGESKLVDDMMSVAPETEGKAMIAGGVLQELLPEAMGVYRYAGSLTTPPCSESVDWNVLQEPVRISDAALSRLIELSQDNVRPVQKLARRFVLK